MILLFSCPEITPLVSFSHCTLSFCILSSKSTSYKTNPLSSRLSFIKIKLCNAQQVTIVQGMSSYIPHVKKLELPKLALKKTKGPLSKSTLVELWALLYFFSSRVRWPLSRLGVIKFIDMGYQESPKIWNLGGNTWTSWKRGLFLYTLASWTDPGYPQKTSKNFKSGPQTACKCIAGKPFLQI